VADQIAKMKIFTGPNGFDAKKYDEFTQNALAPFGMGEPQIEELVKADLSLNRIKQLVATGVSLPEDESKAEFERAYGKLSVSVVRLKTDDFAKEIKATDDEIAKYYEAHKATFKTDEKRKVEFVSLSLNEQQKKLTGKEHTEALQKLADRAEDFSQALLEKNADFHQAAAKLQLPIETTGEFTASAPDPKLKDAPQLANVAFQLNAQQPNSDVVDSGESYYVLHLAGVTESRPLTLEEAKPKVVEAIKTSGARELLSTRGAKVVHDLREGLKAGEPLLSALTKLNVKAEKIEPFSLMEDPSGQAAEKQKNRPSDLIVIKNAAASLQPGDVSEFSPWSDGGIVVVMEKRDPPDQATSQKEKATFATRILDNKKEIAFMEWLQERQKAAGLAAAPQSKS
jgi:hypothetical protein